MEPSEVKISNKSNEGEGQQLPLISQQPKGKLVGKKVIIYAVGGPADPSGGVSTVFRNVSERLVNEEAKVSIIVKDWMNSGQFIYHEDVFKYEIDLQGRKQISSLNELKALFEENRVNVLQLHSWRVAESVPTTASDEPTIIEVFREALPAGGVHYVEHLPVEPGVQGSKELIRERLVQKEGQQVTNKGIYLEEQDITPEVLRDLVLQLVKKEMVLNELSQGVLDDAASDSEAMEQAMQREKNPILEGKAKEAFRMASVLNVLQRVSADAKIGPAMVSFVSEGQLEELCKAFGIPSEPMIEKSSNYWGKTLLNLIEMQENAPTGEKQKFDGEIEKYTKLFALSKGSWGDLSQQSFSVLENATDMVKYDRQEIHERGVEIAQELRQNLKDQYGLNPEEVSIVSAVGRVGIEKGSFELAAAVKQWMDDSSCKENKKLCLRFIGLANEETKLKIHKILGNCDSEGVFKPLTEQIPVYFTPPIQDRTRLAEELCATDLFAVPSTADSFGLSFIEAMALQKPVICSNIPAVKKLFVETGCALGVDTNSKSIFEGFKQFYSMPAQQVDEQTKHAREMVEKRWSLDTMTGNYLKAVIDLTRSPK